MADTITIRTDPELNDALTKLGVTPDARNRSAIIKKAILAYAELLDDFNDPTPSPYDNITIERIPGTTDYRLRFPSTPGSPA